MRIGSISVVVSVSADDKRSLRNLGATPASYQVIRVTTAKSPKPPAN